MNGLRRNFVWLALGLAILLLVAPLWLVAIPGMPDYPAHLAGFSMIAADGHPMPWSPYYHIHWLLVPNLASELVVPLLMHLVSAAAATKLFLSAALILWASAPAAIQYALHKRIDPLALIGALFAYNAPFVWGFFNFVFSSGAALWLFAVWIARAEKRGRFDLVFFAVGFIALCLGHLFAMLAALLLIGSYEIGRAWRDRVVAPAVLVRRALPVLAAAAPAVILFLCLRTPGASENNLQFDILETLEDRASAAIMAYFDQPAQLLTGALAGLWGAGILFRALKVPKAMVPPIVFMVLAALLAPEWAMGGWGVHMRLPAMAGAVMFGAAVVPLEPVRRAGLAAGALAVVAIMSGMLAQNWAGYSRQYSQFRTALRPLPAGVKLFAAIDSASFVTESDQPYWHIAELAIVDKGGFTPLMFATKGQHIVQVNPPYDRIAAKGAQDGSPPDVSELSYLAQARVDLDPDMAVEYPYLQRFPCHFDAVVVFRGSGFASEVPEFLTPVRQGDNFTIYSIDRAKGCPAS
jgi:hypothetical protein